jgi:hypothetical protein
MSTSDRRPEAPVSISHRLRRRRRPQLRFARVAAASALLILSASLVGCGESPDPDAGADQGSVTALSDAGSGPRQAVPRGLPADDAGSGVGSPVEASEPDAGFDDADAPILVLDPDDWMDTGPITEHHVGDPLDVDDSIAPPKVGLDAPRHIGELLDADDPDTIIVPEPAEATRHIGELSDVDDPPAAGSTEGEQPLHLGRPLDAEGAAGVLPDEAEPNLDEIPASFPMEPKTPLHIGKPIAADDDPEPLAMGSTQPLHIGDALDADDPTVRLAADADGPSHIGEPLSVDGPRPAPAATDAFE